MVETPSAHCTHTTLASVNSAFISYSFRLIVLGKLGFFSVSAIKQIIKGAYKWLKKSRNLIMYTLY